MSHIEAIEARQMFSSSISPTRGPVLPAAPEKVAPPPLVVPSLNLTRTGTLFVRGTSERDRIAVKQADGVVSVFNKGQLIEAAASAYGRLADGFSSRLIKRVNIAGGGGRDLITVRIADRINVSLADSTHTDVLTRYSTTGELLDPKDPDNKTVVG